MAVKWRAGNCSLPSVGLRPSSGRISGPYLASLATTRARFEYPNDALSLTSWGVSGFRAAPALELSSCRGPDAPPNGLQSTKFGWQTLLPLPIEHGWASTPGCAAPSWTASAWSPPCTASVERARSCSWFSRPPSPALPGRPAGGRSRRSSVLPPPRSTSTGDWTAAGVRSTGRRLPGWSPSCRSESASR